MMRRLKLLGVALVLAVGVAGCGGSGHRLVRPIHITAARVIRLPPVAKQPSSEPGSGQSDVAFLTARTGFVLDSLGIQRTTDGGRSWAIVWRRRGVQLGAIAVVARTVVATGEDQRLGPVLVRSTDDGATWALIHPVLPRAEAASWYAMRPRLITASLAYMVFRPGAYNGLLDGLTDWLLRSTDGGGHWSTVRLPGRRSYPTGGLAFTARTRGFATGFASQRCSGEIFETTDAGASWHPVPGTCVSYELESLSFPSTSVGYASGGPNGYPTAAAPLALLVSKDGGARWARRLEPPRAPANAAPVATSSQIAFPDPSHGYALVGGCPLNSQQVCGEKLLVTYDGGLRWRETGRQGTAVALIGERDLWVVDAAYGNTGLPDSSATLLWNSTDGGRSWARHGQSSSFALSSLLASGSRLFARTALGDVESDDGVHWRPAHDPALAAAENQTAVGASVEAVEASGFAAALRGLPSTALLISHDGGRTVTVLRPRAFARNPVSAVAFSDDRHGLAINSPGSPIPALVCPGASAQASLRRLHRTVPALPGDAVLPGITPGTVVLATADGGSAWRPLATIPLSATSLAYAGDTAVTIGTVCASAGGTKLVATQEIAISRNGGRTWGRQIIPGLLLGCTPAVAGNTVVVGCASPLPPTELLLVSPDAGRTWRAYDTTTSIENLGLAAAPHRLWLSGPPGALWTSSDAGASWTSEALAFAP